MGCGASKFDTDEEAAPGKFLPLRRRIQEIRRSKNPHAIKDNTLSSKQLLEDEEDSPADSLQGGRKSLSLPAETVGSLKGPSTTQEEDMKVAENVGTAKKLSSEEKGIEAAEKGDQREWEEENVVVMVQEVEKVGKEEVLEVEVLGEEGDDDDDDEEEEEEIVFYPGSPSFREYYVASLDNSADCDSHHTSKDDGKNGEAKRGNQSRRKESIVSLNSSEGSVTILVKKGKKGRIFRRVLPKGGPVAVKNLLNVRSCYNSARKEPSQENHPTTN